MENVVAATFFEFFLKHCILSANLGTRGAFLVARSFYGFATQSRQAVFLAASGYCTLRCYIRWKPPKLLGALPPLHSFISIGTPYGRYAKEACQPRLFSKQ